MFAQVLKALLGDSNRKQLDSIKPIVDQINSFELAISALTDQELQAKTLQFKSRIQNALSLPNTNLIREDVPKMPGQIRTSHDKILAQILEDILPEAFAVCREASRRVLNMRHFDVQLIGGIQLHRGGIAEMQTGEGKTLVCTLAAYLNALSSRGVHVVTVNDYLAKRDSEWMGKLYNFLGLSVGLIIAGISQEERSRAYACDITYGTNNEFGFDYLRDNMETSLQDCVQRRYYMAIVDEVDSILIDEARTPLIISGLPDLRRKEIYLAMNKVAKQLKKADFDKDPTAHYYIDEKAKNIILTDAGIKAAEKVLGVDDLWDPEQNFSHHLIQALRAKELFVKDVDYIVKKQEGSSRNEIVIVDEFTGRLMDGRRWSDGLHQAVEAKEGVPIQEETLTMASITFQNLFRLYPKLSGMTGTAMTEAEEFEKIYNLGVLQIPTNKDSCRLVLNDIVYKTEKMKFVAIAEDIVQAHNKGTPILIGTTSIEKSEAIAEILSKPTHVLGVLEFRIARLIKLLEANVKLKKLLADHSKLFDRPANIKSSDYQDFVSKIYELEPNPKEDLEFAAESILGSIALLEAVRKGLKFNVLNAKHHQKEAQIIREAGRPGAITIATNMAGRGTDIILGGHLSADPNHPDYLKVDKEAQELVIQNGGLYVIGSERHESRRIDNQLCGRSARQGDPGQARFYLSLEDNLMRIFGGEKVISVMNMLKADEDLPIEASIISSAISNSQKKVEAYHFDMRKHVLQFDDVVNTQREVIYRERRQILEGANIHPNILNMINDRIENIVNSHLSPNMSSEQWFDNSSGLSPIAQVWEQLRSDFTQEALVSIGTLESLPGTTFDILLATIKKSIIEFYQLREGALGSDLLHEAERQIMLHVIDTKWVSHLHAMDSLKDGIHLRSYGQKDPLIEYKRESFDMFDELLAGIKRDTVILLYHSQIELKLREELHS